MNIDGKSTTIEAIPVQHILPKLTLLFFAFPFAQLLSESAALQARVPEGYAVTDTLR